jgi:hypothetical protein
MLQATAGSTDWQAGTKPIECQAGTVDLFGPSKPPSSDWSVYYCITQPT